MNNANMLPPGTMAEGANQIIIYQQHSAAV
jgi:hypothetical protein